LGVAGPWDYIVVGAGHNGLVAASILAANGASVLVVESRPTPGGEASGEPVGEAWYPRVAYALGLMPGRLASLLGVDLGAVASWPDPSWVVVVDGEEWLRWWRRPERLEAELAGLGVSRASWREAARLFEGFARCGESEGLLYTVEPPSLGEAADALDRCQPGLGEAVEKPWGSWAPSLLGGELAEALVYPPFYWEPGLVGLYFNMNLAVWGQPRRGFTLLAHTLERAARRLGAEVLYGARARLHYSRGRVDGVELPGGRIAGARRGVLLAASILCLPRLAPGEALDAHLSRGERRALEALASTDLSIDRVNLALAPKPEPPTRWRPPPIVAVESRTASGEAVYPTLHEPPRGGVHLVSFSGVLHGGLEELASELAGPGARLLWAERVDRRVLDSEYCNPTGNPNHIPMARPHLLDSRPLPGWGGYRTPIPGLYHAAASSHPGGQVTGIPGHNAAVRALLDAGVKPSHHLVPPPLLRRGAGRGWGLEA